jgi:hypothetical protein
MAVVKTTNTITNISEEFADSRRSGGCYAYENTSNPAKKGNVLKIGKYLRFAFSAIAAAVIRIAEQVEAENRTDTIVVHRVTDVINAMTFIHPSISDPAKKSDDLESFIQNHKLIKPFVMRDEAGKETENFDFTAVGGIAEGLHRYDIAVNEYFTGKSTPKPFLTLMEEQKRPSLYVTEAIEKIGLTVLLNGICGDGKTIIYLHGSVVYVEKHGGQIEIDVRTRWPEVFIEHVREIDKWANFENVEAVVWGPGGLELSKTYRCVVLPIVNNGIVTFPEQKKLVRINFISDQLIEEKGVSQDNQSLTSSEKREISRFRLAYIELRENKRPNLLVRDESYLGLTAPSAAELDLITNPLSRVDLAATSLKNEQVIKYDRIWKSTWVDHMKRRKVELAILKTRYSGEDLLERIRNNRYASLPEMEQYVYALSELARELADEFNVPIEELSTLTKIKAIQIVAGKKNWLNKEIMSTLIKRIFKCGINFSNKSDKNKFVLDPDNNVKVMVVLDLIDECDLLVDMLQLMQNLSEDDYPCRYECLREYGPYSHTTDELNTLMEKDPLKPQVIVTCGRKTIGSNIPCLDTIVVLAVNLGFDDYMQLMGRLWRRYSWVGKSGEIHIKEKVRFYDMNAERSFRKMQPYIDNANKHGDGEGEGSERDWFDVVSTYKFFLNGFVRINESDFYDSIQESVNRPDELERMIGLLSPTSVVQILKEFQNSADLAQKGNKDVKLGEADKKGKSFTLTITKKVTDELKEFNSLSEKKKREKMFYIIKQIASLSNVLLNWFSRDQIVSGLIDMIRTIPEDMITTVVGMMPLSIEILYRSGAFKVLRAEKDTVDNYDIDTLVKINFHNSKKYAL